MAYCDYIHCESCDCKLIYDEYDEVGDRLGEKFGPEWELLCPTCLATLRAQLAEVTRGRDEARRQVKGLRLVYVEMRQAMRDEDERSISRLDKAFADLKKAIDAATEQTP